MFHFDCEGPKVCPITFLHQTFFFSFQMKLVSADKEMFYQLLCKVSVNKSKTSIAWPEANKQRWHLVKNIRWKWSFWTFCVSHWLVDLLVRHLCGLYLNVHITLVLWTSSGYLILIFVDLDYQGVTAKLCKKGPINHKDIKHLWDLWFCLWGASVHYREQLLALSVWFHTWFQCNH